MPSLTNRTIFWHSVRVFIFAYIMVRAVDYSQRRWISLSKVSTYLLSFLMAIFVYRTLAWLFDLCVICCVRQPMTILEELDELFTADDENEPGTVMIIFRLHRAPFE